MRWDEYFRKRSIKKNQVATARRKQGRHEETTFLIVDAQSVKNTDTAMEKATMRARRLAVSSDI